jgi:hypothetical protein
MRLTEKALELLFLGFVTEFSRSGLDNADCPPPPIRYQASYQSGSRNSNVRV